MMWDSEEELGGTAEINGERLRPVEAGRGKERRQNQ